MADTQMTIDGVDYDWPQLDSFNIRESRWWYEWTGFSVESVGEHEFTSNWVGAFIQIAYARANPGTPPQKARDFAEEINYMGVLTDVAQLLGVEDDAVPPAPAPNEQQPENDGKSNGSPSTSGGGSTPRSVTPMSGPKRSTTGSLPPTPPSVRAISAN
jgi:hypothetical protein